MTTRRLTLAAVLLLAVLVVLAVVVLVTVRGAANDAEVARAFDRCMDMSGIEQVVAAPGYDGVEYANQAAQCGDIAHGTNG